VKAKGLERFTKLLRVGAELGSEREEEEEKGRARKRERARARERKRK
jgi:hypothetical protein